MIDAKKLFNDNFDCYADVSTHSSKITEGITERDVIPAMTESKFSELLNNINKPKFSGISMDGLRLEIVDTVNALHDDVDDMCNEYNCDQKSITERMDMLANLVGILCCTYDSDDSTYNALKVKLSKFNNG